MIDRIMTASELVAALQEQIREHGDKKIIITMTELGYDDNIEHESEYGIAVFYNKRKDVIQLDTSKD